MSFRADWCVLVLGIAGLAGFAAPAHRLDRLLVQPRRGVESGRLQAQHAQEKRPVLRTFARLGGLQVVRVLPGETIPALIDRYQQSGLVEFAEPDYLVQATATVPNDPSFVDGTLWGLDNTGQSGGKPDADVDAPEGWAILTSATNRVVAVLDTGIRYTHEDLAANMWVNPKDGSHGWNVVAGSNDANDDNGHGTLVAGILGAVGNNGLGVVGVAWQIQIMACKCLDSAAMGSDSDVIECIDFARTNGAHIINASFDSSGFSQALSNAIYAARTDGIIFVASAGNNGANLDQVPRYPAGYDIDNIIATAYTTRQDTLGSFSNYGATQVDLAAPGVEPWSTFFRSDNDYFGGIFLFGTSFAAPYVAGTLALVQTRFPSESHQEIIARVLAGTDPVPALAGKCVSGGRLNLAGALNPPVRLQVIPTGSGTPFQLRVSSVPHRECVIEYTQDFNGWTALYTNSTGANGNFTFADESSLGSLQRFYRAIGR